MGEDRGIPDHVNDGVPVDLIDRRERFVAALEAVAFSDGGDARAIVENSGRIGDMKRDAFVNAAINNVPEIIKKLRFSFPGIEDLQGLVDRVRLEVIMRRME